MSICLNMIVKNEEENIGETLLNLVSYIKFDYWVISDTGSTDRTMEIITTFFNERNIPGELHEDQWEDFGTNRTKALEYAFNKTDYLFVFDADDKISGTFSIPLLIADKYMLLFGPTVNYTRPLLVNNRKKWTFIGVLHEYIDCKEPHTTDLIKGNYFVISGRTGNRNKNPNKYRDDAIVLENAFKKETSPHLIGRYAFYCAQSYRDAKMLPESIQWYKKVLELDNWVQEKYYSCIQIGLMSPEESLVYFLKSIQYDEERIEGVAMAMEYLHRTNNHLLVNLLYSKFKNYSHTLENKLFLTNPIYHNLDMDFFNSVSAYYTSDKQSGYDSCKRIIFSNSQHKQQTLLNLRHYMDFIQEDAIMFLSQPFPEEINNELYKKALPYLTKINMQSIEKIRSNHSDYPSIFLSYAHTGNIETFKNTIHSILNTWEDIDKVEYWFCASNMKEGRGEMKKYKWIKQEFTDDAMGCINKKIKELDPKCWIHIENGIFYVKMKYVVEGVRINYAENVFITPLKGNFETKQSPQVLRSIS